MKAIRKAMAVVAVVLASAAVQAALIDRGGGLIYDADRNITWLQDANYAKTSGYDADGKMNWAEAMTWAANLVYGGYDDWRLPTTVQPDPTCYTTTTYGSYGYGCRGGEMGHLDIVEHGRLSSALGPWSAFMNLQWGNSPYWTGTLLAPSAIPGQGSWAWYYRFDPGYAGYSGNQDVSDIRNPVFYAMAVRNGDVAANVPEPSSVLLVGLALAGLGASQRRQFSRG